MCDIADLETCTIWNERKRRARKAHVCSACDGSIKAGQEYWAHFSIFEGEVWAEKICTACYNAREQFGDAHDGVMAPSAFPEMLRHCFGDEARAHWSDEDRGWRSLMAGMLLRGRARAREERCASS